MDIIKKEKRGYKMITKQINQNELSEECWMIQIYGMEYCEGCEYKNTDDCGGKRIREERKNKKGFTIPL